MAEGSEVMRLLASALFIVAFHGIGLAAYAAPLKHAVVKVVSSIPGDSIALRGSGLAFRYDGAGYVLTSDHVVLHDNNGKEHVVYGDKIASTPCEFVTADFGRGVALLKSTTTAGLDTWPRWEDLAWAEAKLDAPAAMMGYPAMADGLLRDVAGKVSDGAKPWDALVQVRHMIEVKGGHAEFGMSGGIVASPLNDAIYGLLSHQVYAPPGGGAQNTILVIPGSVLQDWVKRFFAGKPGDPSSYPVQLYQTTELLRWTHGPAFLSGYLSFGWTDAFGTGRRVIYISSASRPAPGSIFGGETGDLAKVQAFMRKREDCLLYIMGFRSRGAGGSGYVSTPVGVLRSLEDPKREAIFRVRCNEGAMRDVPASEL
jgi:hypothetical protein